MSCVIIVDSREYETANEVVKWLKRLGCTVVPKRLEAGDYSLPGNTGVERKKAMDFISSVIDGRLFEQCKKLKEAYERPYLIVEGDLWRALGLREVHRHSILGALIAISEMGVRTLFTPDEEGTAYTLKALAERNRDKGVRTASVKKGLSIKEAQIRLLTSLPGIGVKRADAILRAFGTPLNALNNVSLWPRKIDGISESVIAVIKKVLLTRYLNSHESASIIPIDELLKSKSSEESA